MWNDMSTTIEIPPKVSVTAMEFTPADKSVPTNRLIASCLDLTVRVWKLRCDLQTEAQAVIRMPSQILDVSHNRDGTIVYAAATDCGLLCIDLESLQIGYEIADCGSDGLRTCNVIKGPYYEDCIMAGSLDKKIMIWDVRRSAPVRTYNVPYEITCADVENRTAVVCTKNGRVHVIKLGAGRIEVENLEVPTAYGGEPRCVATYRDSRTNEAGFAFGNLGGRVSVVSNITGPPGRMGFTSFQCDRRNAMALPFEGNYFGVNDLKVHPVHGTLATVGSDGTYRFWDSWDKQTCQSLMTSNRLDRAITNCCFDSVGRLFAYSYGQDWTQGLEYSRLCENPKIFVRQCFEETRPIMVPPLD